MRYRAPTVIALAVLAAGTSANAASAAQAHRAGCATTMTFLVWPHGHPAIPDIGFGNVGTPHMEIYSGTSNGFPNSKFLGWAAGGKTVDPSPATSPNCLSFASVPKTLKPVATMTTIGRTAAVTCRFPASGSIEITKRSGGAYRYRIRVLLSGGRLAAKTDISPAGVKFHYPAKLCHVQAAPTT